MNEKEQFSFPEEEKKILKFWEAKRIFEKSLKKTEKGKPFTFYDGPPFATGLPHYGHILASTIKDVVPRYQTMKGKFVRRRWGWDCHGLPIEEIVERKLGISGKKQIEEKIGIKEFNETCRSTVLQYVEEWGKMIRRIARWVEFENSYKTMDVGYMESVWWAFKQIYQKGLVYEGRKVLLYCPRCETPVSNFEVAMDNSYKDVAEESVTVKFKLKPGQKIGKNFTTDDKTYILSWTTTPWTLPGNVALAVGKDTHYGIYENKTNIRRGMSGGGELVVREGNYILATDLLNVLIKEGNYLTGQNHQILGKDLVGLEYEPLFEVPAAESEKSFKVYAADFVTTDEGTGIVHTAVVYGEEDYELGVREGLPVVPLLDEKGVFNDKAPEFLRGEYFKKANPLVIADLEKNGLLFKKEKYTHSYPHCWRCGNMLFYNAIPAWFINIQKIKHKLVESNNLEISWFPEHLKHGRYEKSVEAAPDWNISRNRYWGNPIPVWKCKKCKREEVIGSLDELHTQSGGSKNQYWVMRHGEGENNLFNLIDSGQKNLHLTPRGKNQAEDSIGRFKKELDKEHKKIDLIIASDVLRTRETEAIDANVLTGAEIKLDKRLEEIHLGPALTGCHDNKYREMFPTHEERFEKRPEGGESLRDLRKRLWEFLEDTEKKYAGKNILLVSHEYPIWMLFHTACGWSEKQAIAEKVRRGENFTGFAEIEKLDLKVVPRNDTGEVDLHRPYIDEIKFACKSCKGEMERVTEIFDSWMEAGSMPFAEYHYPFENMDVFESRFPAQFVAEYIAQTRAWFYVMHVVSFIIFGKAPFENVVTTGTILAEDGSKMSKSKENFPDPWRVIEKYGADSLRFYLMNSVVMQADNLNFSEKGAESAHRKVGLLLWNVYKYLETYSAGEKSGDSSGKAGVLDEWISIKTDELVRVVTERLDAYDTIHATRAIQDYVDDLSTWYLRRSRKRKDTSFFSTLRDCLVTTSKIIAPFMPFLADELYGKVMDQQSGVKESVHLEEWPEEKSKIKNQKSKILEEMAEVRRLASLALAKRAEAKIKVRQPLASLKIRSTKSEIRNNKDMLKILADEVNVKEVVIDQNTKDEVELDTTITPELREEGILRELARMVQNLRQEAKLRPGDKIMLMLELPEGIRAAISKNEKLLKTEVGAKDVEYKKPKKFDAEASTKLENSEVWLGLRRI